MISTKDLLKINRIKIQVRLKPFSEYRGLKRYSQNGEEGVLDEIIRRIGSVNEFFVEFGAWDGQYLSNTAHLRIDRKWPGVLFEGDPTKVKPNGIGLYNETITRENINKVFTRHLVPKSFALLSIDVDGDDSYCWQGLSSEWKPDIVIIESNPGLPNDVMVRSVEGKSDVSKGYFGANLSLLYDLAKSKGYEFVTMVAWNPIFVRESLFIHLGIPLLDKETILSIHSWPEAWMFWRKPIAENEYYWAEGL
jgi:hypothetical protein